MGIKVVYKRMTGELAVMTSFTAPMVEEAIRLLDTRWAKDRGNDITLKLLKEFKSLKTILDAGLVEEETLKSVEAELDDQE